MSVDWNEIWKKDSASALSQGPSTRSRMRLIRGLLRRYGGGSLLDVGCGTGTLLREASSLGLFSKLTGIDLSEAALGEARRGCPGAEFHVANICETALPEKFDVITCMMVLDLVDDDRRAVSHLSQMLRDGGHLVVVVQHLAEYKSELDDRYGVRRHDRESLTALCAPVGLQPVQLFSWGWPLFGMYYRAMSKSGLGVVGEKSARRAPLMDLATSALTALFSVDDLFTWTGRGRVLFGVFTYEREKEDV